MSETGLEIADVMTIRAGAGGPGIKCVVVSVKWSRRDGQWKYRGLGFNETTGVANTEKWWNVLHSQVLDSRASDEKTRQIVREWQSRKIVAAAKGNLYALIPGDAVVCTERNGTKIVGRFEKMTGSGNVKFTANGRLWTAPPSMCQNPCEPVRPAGVVRIEHAADGVMAEELPDED